MRSGADGSFLRAGKAYNFTLIPAGDEWLALTDGESGKNGAEAGVKETDALPEGERANLRVITQNRTALNQLTAVLPDDSKVIMRQFSGTQPLYTLGEDGY